MPSAYMKDQRVIYALSAIYEIYIMAKPFDV